MKTCPFVISQPRADCVTDTAADTGEVAQQVRHVSSKKSLIFQPIRNFAERQKKTEANWLKKESCVTSLVLALRSCSSTKQVKVLHMMEFVQPVVGQSEDTDAAETVLKKTGGQVRFETQAKSACCGGYSKHTNKA
jgi:hypothetical protein